MRINYKDNYNKIKSSISLKNLKKIIKNKGYNVVKVAINSKVSEATINASKDS